MGFPHGLIKRAGGKQLRLCAGGFDLAVISILSAWAMDTDIFLLDEPTANLDFAATQQLKEILLALKSQGKTLLLSEHRLYYLADIADEYWVMADGEIKVKYTAAEAKALSAEQRQTLSLRTLDLAKITVPEKEPLPKTAPTVLDVSDVRYTYGRKAGDTLSGVSFSVREHEIVGLVGANGCGKTTLGKLVAGLNRPSGGRITLFGKLQNPKQLQKQVLFILQEAEFQFFTNSVLHELQYGHAVTPEFEAKTETLLKSMDMWDCRDRHPFSLSGGQMQRLTLMMAYLSDNRKRQKNKEHDTLVTSKFESRGWTVIRIWECELKKKNRNTLDKKLQALI